MNIAVISTFSFAEKRVEKNKKFGEKLHHKLSDELKSLKFLEKKNFTRKLFSIASSATTSFIWKQMANIY